MPITKIEKLLKERNWKLKTLEEKTGISHSSMSILKRGKRKPEVETAEKIASAFGVQLHEVLGWDEEEISVEIKEEKPKIKKRKK